MSSLHDTRDQDDSSAFTEPYVSDPLSNAREMIVTVIHTPNSVWAQPVTTAETVRDFSAKMKEYFLTNPTPLGLITLKRTMKVAAKLVTYFHTSVVTIPLLETY